MAADPEVRLCLDLNIWVSDLIAGTRRLRGGAARALVDVVRDGVCELGRIQVVVSWGMLNRLEAALARDFDIDRLHAQSYIRSIATMAQRGPAATGPYLLLGGTGVLPVRDEEDRGVLETAFAGRAHVLVTRNFRDFVGGDAKIVVRDEIAVVRRAERDVIVAQPSVMLRWMRRGAIELPER